MRKLFGIAIGALAAFAAAPALAAEAHGLDGAKLSPLWGVPFLGILLSIAILPAAASHFWHRHYGKVAAFWVLVLILPLALVHGIGTTRSALAHAIILEYVPFIVLLFTLFTVAGGILVTGNLRATPGSNVAILAIGTLMASVVGTTGASMILIRPLIRAIKKRRHKAHIVVFFIILVANVGGALSPLGDPPLFVGFLRGVDFFWPLRQLWLQTLIVASILLAIFFALDLVLYRREGHSAERRKAKPTRIGVRGGVNFALLAFVIAGILLSSEWNPGVNFDIYGAKVSLEDIGRDAAFLLIAGLSLWLTPQEHREANEFNWEPIREVAILFAGIFIGIIPVLAMLQAGRNGLFAPLLEVITYDDGMPHEVAYFWLTGLLSAFLDNAPTYLVFFELAGGDAQRLMGPLAGTLAGISMGAVYMGALTYIGNAPNFMISAIALERGIKMPSFFAYLFWAALVLLPLFLLLTFLPLAPVLRSY